jgi:hypothetical protein
MRRVWRTCSAPFVPRVVRRTTTILDQLVADYYIKQLKPSGKVKAVGEPVAEGQMTLPVRKDGTVLLGILNKGIEMVGDSEFEGIYEKWMGQ